MRTPSQSLAAGNRLELTDRLPPTHLAHTSMVATKLGRRKQLETRLQLVKQTATSAGIHALKQDSMHRAKIDWKQYQQAQHKQVHTSSTSAANQSSGKLFNMGAAIKRLDSNTVAVATAAIKQATAVAIARYKQRMQASNRPHKAEQGSQTKVRSTCYCYVALNKFAGLAVAIADQLPKFGFWLPSSLAALHCSSTAARRDHSTHKTASKPILLG